MKKRNMSYMLAAALLFVPLVAALVATGQLASATAMQGPLIRSFDLGSNLPSGQTTHYTYGVSGEVRETFDVSPAGADWATPSNIVIGIDKNSSAERFIYSNNGKIEQTSDPMNIPATAAWATIFSFGFQDLGYIDNPLFHYSMNGTDTLTTTDATQIPSNAVWAALVSFDIAEVTTGNVQFTSYSLGRSLPTVVSLSIASESGAATYIRPGDSLTVTLVTDQPIMKPILKIGGITLFAEGGGTRWQGGLYIFDYNLQEGPISVSAEFYSATGAPGTKLTATTDGANLMHDKSPPSLSYELSPVGQTGYSVTVHVTASDPGSGVELLKWAAGSRDASHFSSGGTSFTDKFIVSENGEYTIYARDHSGLEATKTVTVSNIDREAPTLTLTPSTTAPTSEDITVTAIAEDNAGIGKLLWAVGEQDASYFEMGNGTLFEETFLVSANGTYTVYAEDALGNYTLKTIQVTNILRQAPSVTLTPATVQWSRAAVKIDIDVEIVAENSGNTLAALRWARGEQEVSYFAADGGSDALATASFDAGENGRYSVYARDALGNEGIEQIDIANIDQTAPALTLTPSTTAPTNSDVTINVTATDDESGLASVAWSDEAPTPGLPWVASEVVDGTFTLEENGTYTVIATDHAGNETMQQVTVANIDREAPTLTLTPSTTTPTNADITVTAIAVDNVAIGKLLWAEGEQEAAYFESGNGSAFTDTFLATANGTYTVYAEDTAGNPVLEKITINNISRQTPDVTLTADPTDWTNQAVTVRIDAQATGSVSDNTLAALRWAKGEQDVAFFAGGGGEDVFESAEVSADGLSAVSELEADENGSYTVYARDVAGNEKVEQIDIANIDQTGPALTLTPSTTEPTNDSVMITVTASDDDSGLASVAWSDEAPTFGLPWASSDVVDGTFTVEENGTYTVIATDHAGNETMQQVTVANIDREAPTLTMTPNTTEPTKSDITVTATAVDNVGIGKLLWAEGEPAASYFEGGNGTDFENTFLVSANGTYTVYAEDTAGNPVLEKITISNISRQAPDVTLTADPTDWTNQAVTVRIEAQATGSVSDNTLAALRWAKGEQDAAFFADGGGEDALESAEVSAEGVSAVSEFEADENGRYTVYARDVAGNETVEGIDIANIDQTAPALTLTPSTTGPTNDSVTITVTASDDDSGLASVAWSAEAPVPDVPWASSDVVDGTFTVEENGTYTVIATDHAGNETTEQVTVTNIDREAPTLTLTPSTTTPINMDITVTAAAADNVAIGRLLWAEGEPAASYFEGGNGTDFEDTFLVSANGTYTVYAEDTAGNHVLETVAIHNISRQAPDVTLIADPTDWTNKAVTVSIDAQAFGGVSGNTLAALRWAQGEQDAAFFAGGGGEDALGAASTEVSADGISATASFEAIENGSYTVYARDAAGNEKVEMIDIANIDQTAPALTLTPSTTAPTNSDVTITVTATDDESGLASVAWSAEAPVPDVPWASSDVVDGTFTVEENDTYTVIATDHAGNETTQQVTVANIDREAPTLTLTPRTTEPTNADITVTVTAVDNVGIGKLLWAEGEQDAAYFDGGNGSAFEETFMVTENGTYTVYAEDTAGNPVLEKITINNISRQASDVTLTADPTDWTNQAVTVSIDAQTVGGVSGNTLAALRWAHGEQDAAFFADGGGEDALESAEVSADGVSAVSELEADENGRYTVYARDVAGNETVEGIDIANIDQTAPALTLTPSTTAPTNGDVTITVTATDDESGLASVAWSIETSLSDIPQAPSEVVGETFTVEANGTYTVIATDHAGNETTQQVTVANILREPPTLTLVPETTEPVGDRVAITAEAAAQGTGNAIASLRWASGEQTLAYFREGAGEPIAADATFDATANGVYTVYVRDIAGNEAMKTIAIDNIRRTNAALSSLLVRVGGTELPLSPVFDPDQRTYAIQVGTAVDKIILAATAGDEAASVAINGAELEPGASAELPVSLGSTTIRVVVTAQLTSVQQTYTIQVTRPSPISGGVVLPPTLAPVTYHTTLNGEPVSLEMSETLERNPEGRLAKVLRLGDAKAITAAATSKANELIINWAGASDTQIDAVRFQLSAQARAQLAEGNIRLTVRFGSALYEWPVAMLAAARDEIVLEMKTLRQSSHAERVLNGARAAGASEFQIELVGMPVEVTAGARDTLADEGWLALPLPERLDKAALRRLAVYVEDGDGLGAIMPGTVRYDEQGRAVALAVRAGAVRLAAVLQAEPIRMTYDRYIGGYDDNRFAPSQTVTRAELATMLGKLSPADGEAAGSGDGSVSQFTDSPSSHWASSAIARAAAEGWMTGRPDGSFGPGEPLTRAELATVLVRWCEVPATGEPDFPDAATHWAASAIAAAQRQGWITGYADGSFRPDRQVTRAEAVVLLNRVLARPPLTDGGDAWTDVPSSYWAAGDIRSASQSFEARRYLSGETDLVIGLSQ